LRELNRQGAKDAKKMQEPSTSVDELAHAVIGAAIEVHRVLGPGYLERVYEEALALEMTARGVGFERQKPIAVLYKGHAVGASQLDFLVGGQLVVELKTVECFAEIHKAQLISYLKATGHSLGLLINFNVTLLKNGVKRVVLSQS
jgi:GxxExxY protein